MFSQIGESGKMYLFLKPIHIVQEKLKNHFGQLFSTSVNMQKVNSWLHFSGKWLHMLPTRALRLHLCKIFSSFGKFTLVPKHFPYLATRLPYSSMCNAQLTIHKQEIHSSKYQLFICIYILLSETSQRY